MLHQPGREGQSVSFHSTRSTARTAYLGRENEAAFRARCCFVPSVRFARLPLHPSHRHGSAPIMAARHRDISSIRAVPAASGKRNGTRGRVHSSRPPVSRVKERVGPLRAAMAISAPPRCSYDALSGCRPHDLDAPHPSPLSRPAPPASAFAAGVIPRAPRAPMQRRRQVRERAGARASATAERRAASSTRPFDGRRPVGAARNGERSVPDA